MAAKSRRRKRLFADHHVQGALIVRVVLYWLTCLLAIMLVMLAKDLISGPKQPWNARFTALWTSCGPVAIASLMLLPVVIVDILRVSHRFIGPLFRLRRSMHELAQGMPVAMVRFRKGDFWQEMASDFNTIAARTEQVCDDPAHADRAYDLTGELQSQGSGPFFGESG
jgi:hypothetical protein